MTYAVVAFVILQVAQLLADGLDLPSWVFRSVTFVSLIGFPVALLLAWALEVTPEGIKREREMVELAHKHNIRLFGPNSQGIQNADPEISVYANFTFVPMKPGNISIIAQGGGMGEMLKLHLHNVGLGHRMYCSYGNECDLTMPEIP